MSPDQDELIRLQEELRACIERLEWLPDWIWEIDPEGRLTYSNSVVERMLGFKPDELMGKSPFVEALAEDAERCASALAEAVEFRIGFEHVTCRVRDSGGELHALDVCTVPLLDQQGNLTGFRAIARDLTEQERAQKVTQEALANYRRLIDDSPTGIVVLQDGKIVFANPLLLQLMGYAPGEAIGVDVARFIHPDDRHMVLDNIARRLRGEAVPSRYEIRLLTEMGETLHFWVQASIISYNGRPAVLDNLIHITEQKRAEEALRQSEEKFRGLVENLNDWVWEVDTKGRYTYVSPRSRTLLGYEPEELIGKHYYDVMENGEANRVRGLFEAVQARRESFALLENTLRRKDGSLVTVETSGEPVFADGDQFVGYRGVDRDITARKRAQDALKASEERLRKQQAALAQLAKIEAIGTGDLQSAFGQMAELGAQTLEVERVNFWRFSKDRSKIQCVDGFILSQDAHSCDADVSVEGHLGYFRAIEAGPVIAHEAVSYESTRDFAEDYLKHYGITSMNDAPIRLRGVVVGIVCFEHIGPARQWTSDEDIFVSSVASLASIALEAAERSEAEQALRESEERYRSFVQNFQGVAFRSTMDRQPVFIHGAVEAITGYSVDDFLTGGIKWIDLVHPDDLQAFIEDRERFLSVPGCEIEQEHRIVRKDGGVAWIHTYVRNVTDESGNPAFVEGSFYDVTEQRVARDRLIRFNETLLSFGADPKENINSLVELFGELLAADAALYSQLESGVLCTFGKWQAFAGEEVIEHPEGRICYDLIQSKETGARLIRNLQETDYKDTDPTVAEYGLQTYYGKAVRFAADSVGSLCAVFKRDFVPTESDEWLQSVIASAIGVEERRERAEEALAEAEAKYRSLVDESLTGVYLIQDDRFAYVNPRFAEMFGYTQDEMVCDKPAAEFVAPEDREMVSENIRRRIEGEVKSVHYELRGVRKDGRVIDLEAFGSGTVYQGRPAIIGTAIDVTQSKRAQDALRESQEKYRDLVETTDTGYMIIDTQGHVIDANAEYVRLTGRGSLDEIVGHSVLEWTAPYDVERNEQELRKCAEKGFVRNLNIDYVSPAGRVTPIEINATVTEGAEGTSILTLCRDITERKRAEDALAEAEAKYRSLVDESLTGVYLIQDNRLVYVNPKYAEIFGYQQDEIIGKSITDLVAPEDQITVLENIRRRVQGETKSIRYDYRGLRKDGQVIEVEVFGSTTTYQGRPAIIGSLLDITESKRAEAALRYSEDRYRVLFEQSPDMLFLLEGSVWVAANPAVERLLGYRPEEVIGKHPWDVSPELQPDGLRSEDKAEKILSGLKENEPVNFDWVHQRKDGSLADCEVSLVAYETHGRRAAQAIVRDVTERKQAEDGRREYERQTEAQKRQFYRDTILSVTDGKLDICDVPEIRQYVAQAMAKIDVRSPADVGSARHLAEEFCKSQGLTGERLESFMIAVGEAITNAIKHGHEGRVYMGIKDGSVWVGVSDKGKGIESLILPRATLLRGFSTKPSLGLGYSIMLDVADHILLKTDRRGTFVILIKSIEEPELVLSAEVIPDTWRSIIE